MYLQIEELIIWPRNRQISPRRVPFQPGKVNVISGASKTGKSAIIPIIDYCLASDSCSIPVGVIRDACEWFGIVVATNEGRKLLARKEPGSHKSTEYMYVLEGDDFEVPDYIEQANARATEVKRRLDVLAGLTEIPIDAGSDSQFLGRPSFRDMMAFCFQSQNVIANPNVLFYKADTHEHRQKLRNVFPYVLGAVSEDDLRLQAELVDLKRQFAKKQMALDAMKSGAEEWQGELKSWVIQAQSFGLLESSDVINASVDELLSSLRSIPRDGSLRYKPSYDALKASNSNLVALEEEESELNAELQLLKGQMRDIERLGKGSTRFSDGLAPQRERLGIARWMREQMSEDRECPICATPMIEQRAEVDGLVDALEEIEKIDEQFPRLEVNLDKQRIDLKKRIEFVLSRLTTIRETRDAALAASEKLREAERKEDEFNRFLGRLQQSLRVYDRSFGSSRLIDEVSDLASAIKSIEEKLDTSASKARLYNAKRDIEKTAGVIASDLDAEWPNATIELLVDDLTIAVKHDGRRDYLWEIGSGANWVSYHVAISLALQLYFCDLKASKVPSFLVFDQPSQVYFPRRLARPDESRQVKWTDEDITAVRKIFLALGKSITSANGALQTIVLDHAGHEVWAGIEGIFLSQEWRGEKKLVPESWLVAQGQ